MTREASISAKIRLAAPHHNARLFRNQVGQYFIHDEKGEIHVVGGKKVRGRWIKYGLGKGSPDLIGWKTVKITPEMVGEKIAIFIVVEVKREGKTPRRNQKAWIQAIETAGGLAGVARSVDDAKKIINPDTEK